MAYHNLSLVCNVFYNTPSLPPGEPPPGSQCDTRWYEGLLQFNCYPEQVAPLRSGSYHIISHRTQMLFYFPWLKSSVLNQGEIRRGKIWGILGQNTTTKKGGGKVTCENSMLNTLTPLAPLPPSVPRTPAMPSSEPFRPLPSSGHSGSPQRNPQTSLKRAPPFQDALKDLVSLPLVLQSFM